jgi:molecular chaperone GrpE
LNGQDRKYQDPENYNTAEALSPEPAAEGNGTDTQHLSEIEQMKAVWEKEREELMGRLMRRQADFENFRRISRTEQEETREYSLFRFFEKLLPILDNLERALGSARGESVPDAHIAGLDMIYRQLFQLMEQEGVAVMDPTGRPFDPNYHHAVLEVEEGEPGCVAGELQKGYLYKKKVLRPALVKVCRG